MTGVITIRKVLKINPDGNGLFIIVLYYHATLCSITAY